MKTHIPFLILPIILFLSSSATGQNAVMKRELAHKIKSDTRLIVVSEEARKLVSSGFNAGGGYSEVWIRDLNTFTELATKVTDNKKLKEALLTFFKFQGKDGNIMDGYTEIKNASSGGVFYYSKLAPEFAAHKNTVETDQETSLIQAIYKYIEATGDRSILKVHIDKSTVEERMGKALDFLLEYRFDKKHGLLWGATTADWGDVQPEHDWGVVIDSSSHFAIDIYDNAMFVIALNNYIDLLALDYQKKPWKLIKEEIVRNTKNHLWDQKNNKYRTHIYLKDSPFPSEFDENKIYYHGGTAIAIEAGLLNKKQVKQAYAKMKANMKAAGAQSIGLTLYPVYPNGFFKNKGMSEYGYQNGGDWTWFGGRMVQQLIHYGLYEEAYEALSPMLDRVLLHKGFYEWWTPSGEPKGSGQFRGSAGVLWSAIEQLNAESVQE